LSENNMVNKLLIAPFLLIAAFPIRGQSPAPSVPSAVESFASPQPSPSGATVTKIDPEKEKLIRQVMARTKEAELAQERILSALAGMKTLMPRVGEKYWEKYRQLVSVEELTKRLVYVYDKHYTSQELNDLLKFYDSPLGKKMSEEAIPILRGSMDIAQDLSKRAAQSVASEYQAEQLLQRPRAAGSLGPAMAPFSNDAVPSASPMASATPAQTPP
jgi:uncharacterized protein